MGDNDSLPTKDATTTNNDLSNTSIRKPLKKFKSQSVNDLFKSSHSIPSPSSSLSPSNSNTTTVSGTTTIKHSNGPLRISSPASIRNATQQQQSGNTSLLANSQGSSQQGPSVTTTTTTTANNNTTTPAGTAAAAAALVSNQPSPSGIKTLSLASGPKLKIIPEKKFLLTPSSSSSLMNNGSFTSGSPNFNQSLTSSKLISDENNYWKKSRSASPDIKKDTKETTKQALSNSATNTTYHTQSKQFPLHHAPQPSAQPATAPKKVESSRFTFSNLSHNTTNTNTTTTGTSGTSGFNWADIDDDEDDTFSDKIWNSLAPQLGFDNNKTTNSTTTTTTATPKNDIIQARAPPQGAAPQAIHLPQQSSIMSPSSATTAELFSPSLTTDNNNNNNSNAWASTSPLLGFRKNNNNPSSINFNDTNSHVGDGHGNGNGNGNNSNYFSPQQQQSSASGFTTTNNLHTNSLSSSLDKLSFTGNEPVKQELFNPMTGKVEVFSNNHHGHGQNHGHRNHSSGNAPPSTHNDNFNIRTHHSFDSSYINHTIHSDTNNNNNNNSSAKASAPDFWKSPNTVWNSRENSLSGAGAAAPGPPFSPNLKTDPWPNSNFEIRNSFGTTTAGSGSSDNGNTTPSTLRGASRFFPSPRTEQHNTEYFPQQQQQAPASPFQQQQHQQQRFVQPQQQQQQQQQQFQIQPQPQQVHTMMSTPMTTTTPGTGINLMRRHPSDGQDPLSTTTLPTGVGISNIQQHQQHQAQAQEQGPKRSVHQFRTRPDVSGGNGGIVEVQPKKKSPIPAPTTPSTTFEPRSGPIDDLQEVNNNENSEEEIKLSFPMSSLATSSVGTTISNSKESITRFVLNDSIHHHPEGFSSTFYKRGVNNFMFVRELQSKVAINKIKGHDFAEFRVNIPISSKSYSKLAQAQAAGAEQGADATQGQGHDSPLRIKRSYIIYIDARELEGKVPPSSSSSSSKNKPFHNDSSNSNSTGGGASGNRKNTYIRPGYRENTTKSTRRGGSGGGKVYK